MILTLVYLILILVVLALTVLSAFVKPVPPQNARLIDLLAIVAAGVALLNFGVELLLSRGGGAS